MALDQISDSAIPASAMLDDSATGIAGVGADQRSTEAELSLVEHLSRNHARELRALGKRLLVAAATIEWDPEAPAALDEVNGRADVHRPNEAVLVSLAQSLYRARRRRAQFMSQELFGEPGWDLMLDLFIQRSHGRVTSTTSACIASGVPLTTALRRIALLEEQGLVERKRDGRDHRVNYIVLTVLGLDTIRACLATVWQDFWQ